MFDLDDDDLAELATQVREAKRRESIRRAHPDPRDPEHPEHASSFGLLHRDRRGRDTFVYRTGADVASTIERVRFEQATGRRPL